MKLISLISFILPVTLGFPTFDAETFAALSQRSGLNEPRLLQEKRERLNRRAVFDPSSQYISTNGTHEFKAPNLSAGDQRGPCPGLNALANHNYLPRNGVADIPTLIAATNKVYGMALDLGTFLAIYGTVFDGNPLSLNPGFSIGGPTKASQNILGGLGLLGTPSGLSGSHNKYESDVSPTRGDLYKVGNNFKVQLPQFKQYYDALKPVQGKPSDVQFDGLLDFHKARFDDSVNTNPYFFYSPFSGVLVSPAGYAFPKAMMANHSAEFPDGTLSLEVFKSFFAVSGDEDSFVYKEGHERIPDNWYRRPVADYSIPAFLVDVLDHGVRYPRLLSVGGNTGKVNTFTPVDLGNLTGGVFNAATLAEGNNLECFVYQSIQAATPDILGTTVKNPAAAARPLLDTIRTRLGSLACPQLTKFDSKLFEKYPGYKRSGGAV